MEEGKKMVKRKIQEEEEDDEEEEDQEEQQEWLHPEREVEETDTSDNEEEEDDQTRGMGGRTDNRRLITFLKATRRGKIRKIVREIYLRDDIPCGLRGCCFCYPEPEDDRREEEDHDGSIQGGRINEIERRGEGGGRGDRGVLNMDERILIFDSQALLDHIDFLQEDPSATNCLILSSVLSQVKHTNVQTYSTLRALCRQSTEEDEDAGKENFSSRHLSSSSNSLKAGNERGSIASSSSSSSSSRPFFIFSNEFFRPTFVDRREEETLEEKDRRGMWKAARWYSQHLSGVATAVGLDESRLGRVTVLTNDKKVKAEAKAAGVDAMTVHEYAKEMRAVHPTAGEKLANVAESDEDGEKEEEGSKAEKKAKVKETVKKEKKALYESHLNESEINRRLKKKQVYQGKLRMASDCCWRGVVVIPGGEEIKIRGKANLNRAVEGDVVAVEIVSGGKTPSDTKKTSPSQPTSGSASSLSPSLITKEEEEKKKSEDRRDGKISVKQSSQEEEKENGGKDEDVGAKEFTASEEAQAEIKEIEDESLAVFPTAEMTDEEDEDEENKKEEETMEKDLSAEYLSDDILEGKVVGIIRKNRREYCGTVRPFNNPFRTELATRGLPAEVVFIPADRRIPNIILKTRRYDQLVNKRIVVVIDSWDRFSRNPRGHWTEILGDFGTAEAEANLILREQGVVTRDFSLASLRCLPPRGWTIDDMPIEEKAQRLDLRHICVCSVDPPGCKDIDDALSLEVLEDGNYRVGVHIADVTYFLKEGTPLDDEASERCTTVYLVERRTDMLPALLTTDLCSLVGGQDRLAFSVLWVMTPKGEILSSSFHKSFIHSRAALTYAEAQNMIDDPSDRSELSENLRRLLSLSKVIREKRMQAGALQLASPDVQIIRETITEENDNGSERKKKKKEKESGDVVKTEEKEGDEDEEGMLAVGKRKYNMKKKKRGEEEEREDQMKECHADEVTEEASGGDIALYQARDTNRMVEDFMLLANTTVAEKIVNYFPTASLLRRHPEPKERQLKALKDLLQSRGISHFDFSSSKTLGASLNYVAQTAPDLDFLVRILTTRCMNQAVYFSSADILPNSQSERHSITTSLSSSSSSPDKPEVSPYFHHYGLAAPIYTHFTSPIRRYADVVVHRMLAAAIGIEGVPSLCRNKQRLTQQCELLNVKHRNAQIAGRNSVQYHVYLYFKHKGSREAVGTVTKVKKNGVMVYIHKYGLEGIVFLKEQEFIFDAEKQALKHRESGDLLKIFDALLVRIEADHSNDFRPEVTMKYIRKATEQDRER